MVTNRLIKVNFTKGRHGYKPIYIVLHTMVGTIQGTRNWFNNPNAKASAHYGVGFNGEIDRYVKESDIAWANGTRHSASKPNLNYVSISIEAEDKGNPNDAVRTEQLYESMAWLMHRIGKTYNIPLKPTVPHGPAGILLHRQSNPKKSCPGQLNISKLIKMAELIRSLEKRIDDSETKLKEKDELINTQENRAVAQLETIKTKDTEIVALKQEITKLKVSKPEQSHKFNLFRFLYEIFTKNK